MSNFKLVTNWAHDVLGRYSSHHKKGDAGSQIIWKVSTGMLCLPEKTHKGNYNQLLESIAHYHTIDAFRSNFMHMAKWR